jgi:hypothetical protein
MTETKFRTRNTALHSEIDAVNSGTKFWILFGYKDTKLLRAFFVISVPFWLNKKDSLCPL